jgi:hypothetical protein
MAGLMAPLRSSKDGSAGGLRGAGDDAFHLTVDYVKQETIEPLKGLGRFLAWGLAGSFAIAVGVLLLLVGVLRLLQGETGRALTGDWSWVPYFAVSALGLAVVGLAAWRIMAGPAQRKLPKVRTGDDAPLPEFLPPVTPPVTSVTPPVTQDAQEGSS